MINAARDEEHRARDNGTATEAVRGHRPAAAAIIMVGTNFAPKSLKDSENGGKGEMKERNRTVVYLPR
jgi:hypothetical protein